MITGCFHGFKDKELKSALNQFHCCVKGCHGCCPLKSAVRIFLAEEAGAGAAEVLKGPIQPSGIRSVDSAHHLLAAFHPFFFLFPNVCSPRSKR